MPIRPFESKLEVFKRIEKERKSGKEVFSRKSIKELKPEELRRLKEIKTGREAFLKEIGLIGNHKDTHLNLRRYEIFKKRTENYQRIIQKLEGEQKVLVDKLYKEAYIQLLASRYIRSIIPKIQNQAMKTRIQIALMSSDFELISSGEWNGRNHRFENTTRSKDSKLFMETHKKLYDMFYKTKPEKDWGRGTRRVPLEDFRRAHFPQELLNIVFKKHPFLKNPDFNNKKYLSSFEKEINKLANEIQEMNNKLEDTDKTFEKHRSKISDVINASWRLKPIIWDPKLDIAFKKRYGITLREVYSKFITNHDKPTIPISIIDNVLEKCLHQNTLLVFPLRGSLFNYYLTRGVVEELKRLDIAKKELNAITLTADTFKHWNSLYNMESYTYSNTYHDIVEKAPDIVSGQLNKIFPKHPNVSRVVFIDWISSGFQRDYTYYYMRKYFYDRKKSPPDMDSVTVTEEQKLKFDNREIEPADLVSKKTDEVTHGTNGYINPQNSKWVLENKEKIREILEVAGRLFVRAELINRGKLK
ncbi:MAG: hypothetical protein WCF78_04060 [archaeon]